MLIPARILVNVEGNDKLIQALNHFVSAITNTFEAEEMLRDKRPGSLRRLRRRMHGSMTG